MIKINPKELRARALLAADWFLNCQIPVNAPQWDANAGRFIYNYHIPTQKRVSALSWTQGRGIMVLMAAYRLTKEKKYLDCAYRAIDYLNALQIEDETKPYVGAFAEEIPQSDKCWPRDGAEAASGYLHLYNETGDKELLRRARSYGDFLLKNSHPKHGFPPVRCYFKPYKLMYRPDYFTVGSGMFYGMMYQATGERKWLTKGLKPMIDALPKLFLLEDGALTATNFASHHCEKEGRHVVLNDDGSGAAMLFGARLLKTPVYLQAAEKMAQWMMTQTRPVNVACSLPSRLCFIMDVYRQTGQGEYFSYVLSRLKEVLDLQVLRSADPCVKGGFRGEDEGGEGYVKGGDKMDFVTTRVSAYSALLLFKLISKDWSTGYSAFGWKRKRK